METSDDKPRQAHLEPRYQDIEPCFLLWLAQAMTEGHLKYEKPYSVPVGEKNYYKGDVGFVMERYDHLFQHVLHLGAILRWRLRTGHWPPADQFEGWYGLHIGHVAANLNMISALVHYGWVGHIRGIAKENRSE